MTTDAVAQVVLLTPEGRGAVASVLVSGTGATALVEALFHPAARAPLAAQPLERIVYGRWQRADTGEEVVVCRRGESQVEIHCHGGVAAARAIIDSLVERGGRQTDWREWIRQSVDDPIAAAAQIALAGAPTGRVATVLWDQLDGALRRAVNEIATFTTRGELCSAVECVDRLLAWAPLGRHLVEPWRVVLAGRPNVGKSSLINALVGYERAIVHPTPGTTRDIVTVATAIDGWPVELTDTAGLHASPEPLESVGIALARARLAAADLVVLVFDASRSPSDDDVALARDWPQALAVWNKRDLISPGQDGEAPPGALLTSATGRLGLESLQRQIGRRLVSRDPPPGEAVPFLAEHVECLLELRDLLREGQSDAALRVLASGKCWSRRPC